MTKILAIDDEKNSLIVIKSILKKSISHCEVITVQSGIEGIEKAKKENPDVILLDIQMPLMDGFEVCKRLKSDEKTKNIPIIFLTAFETNSKNRIKGLELGADAFLTKPVDEAELISQINVMLRIKKTEDKIRNEKDLLEVLVQERTSELQASENKYRTTLNAMGDPIHVVNSDLVISLFNDTFKQWCKNLNLDTDAIGKTIFELFPFLPYKVRDEYKQVFKTAKVLITEEETIVNNKKIIRI